MHEIELLHLSIIPRRLFVDLIPADFGNLESHLVRKPADPTLEDAERVDASVLLRMLEENLHAETYAEERTPRKRGGTDRIDQSCPLQVLHRALRRADPGEYDTVGGGDDCGIIRHRRRLPDRRERQPYAREIPRPVVNYRRHHTIPAFLSL